MAETEIRDCVLVTGAAGFIGYHVAERFLRQGTPVLGMDRMDSTYAPEIKQANLRDLHRVAKECDTVFHFENKDLSDLDVNFSEGQLHGVVHLAARAGVRQSTLEPEAYTLGNVLGTLRVLELCRAQGIDRLLFASSSSVYGDDTPPPFAEDANADRPLSVYAATKRAGELYCASYAHLHGLRIAALRFFTVYGPRQRPLLAIHQFAHWMEQDEPVRMFGDGSSERSYTYIDDAVDGVFAAWEHLEQQDTGYFNIFNLGSPETVSLREMIRLLEAAMQKEAEIIQEPVQAGDVQRTVADLQYAEETLGYRPKISFAEGIQRFADWYRTRPKSDT